jgi:hypothetical protein
VKPFPLLDGVGRAFHSLAGRPRLTATVITFCEPDSGLLLDVLELTDNNRNLTWLIEAHAIALSRQFGVDVVADSDIGISCIVRLSPSLTTPEPHDP